MKRPVSRIAAIFAIALAGSGTPMAAKAQETSEGWKFSLMPYIWLPTIDANLNLGPVAGSRLDNEISLAPSEWLPDLKMTGLLAGEVPVDRRPADARGRADVVDAGGAVPALGEEVGRRTQDLVRAGRHDRQP